MGWKASALIITDPVKIDYEELLWKLGYSNLKRIEDEPFEVAINPDDNKVYIGTYKGNLLICEQNLPARFFEPSQTKYETRISQIFAASEICSIILHSAVNLWGYSITVKGEKVRARAGSADDGTFCEMGHPVLEENELLSKSQLNEAGNRIYFLEDPGDEALTEDQVGENFVFAITKRYFGEELDQADDLLFETTLIGYSFSNLGDPPKNNRQEDSNISVKPEKPWWRFW